MWTRAPAPSPHGPAPASAGQTPRSGNPLRRPEKRTSGGLLAEARGPTSSPHADFWRLWCAFPSVASAACSEGFLREGSDRPPASWALRASAAHTMQGYLSQGDTPIRGNIRVRHPTGPFHEIDDHFVHDADDHVVTDIAVGHLGGGIVSEDTESVFHASAGAEEVFRLGCACVRSVISVIHAPASSKLEKQ